MSTLFSVVEVLTGELVNKKYIRWQSNQPKYRESRQMIKNKWTDMWKNGRMTNLSWTISTEPSWLQGHSEKIFSVTAVKVACK